MNTNIAVYAGGPLGPADIKANTQAVKDAGWTTVILGLFHIGNPDNVADQHWGDIIFNGQPEVISEGEYVADSDWPAAIAALKSTSAPTNVSKIYASFGGGMTVVDFSTIKSIYENNGHSFHGTALKQNFEVFRRTFPAIDGIDLDCEETYDVPSFVAFCEMLAQMGFNLTAAPYRQMPFWTAALKEIAAKYPDVWQWWNLQCYGGGLDNNPQTWADAIHNAIPDFNTDGFIVAGESAGDGPSGVTSLLSAFAKEPCVSGGFIWNMDAILESHQHTMKDYVDAIQAAFATY